MALLACIACYFASEHIRSREEHFRARSMYHEFKVSDLHMVERSIVIGDPGESSIVGAVPDWRLRAIEYHERMARKYEDASRHPWMSVEPDPPPALPPGVSDPDYWMKEMRSLWGER